MVARVQMLLQKPLGMLRRYFLALLALLAGGVTTAEQQSKSEGQGPHKNPPLVFIDVEDEGHLTRDARKGNGDATTIKVYIYSELIDLGYNTAASDADKTNAELHVICRFKHGIGKPTITRGAQIKGTYINECTLTIIEGKTHKVMLTKTYIRKSDEVGVDVFIKQAFKEWKDQRKKGVTSHSKPDANPKK